MKIQETMITAKHRIAAIVVIVAIILSIPLVAMQFTNEVKWNLFDFLVMGTLLMATGFGIELVIRKVKSYRSRLLICLALLFIFFLVWAELAVGIFGSPFAGS